jgi:hypothetical protein
MSHGPTESTSHQVRGVVQLTGPAPDEHVHDVDTADGQQSQQRCQHVEEWHGLLVHWRVLPNGQQHLERHLERPGQKVHELPLDGNVVEDAAALEVLRDLVQDVQQQDGVVDPNGHEHHEPTPCRLGVDAQRHEDQEQQHKEPGEESSVNYCHFCQVQVQITTSSG